MKRFFRYYYLRVRRLKGRPDVIARGIAIGLFIGITPTIPLHTVLLVFLCVPLRGSKIAAFLFAWLVSNPLTVFAQYYCCWFVGSWFFPGHLSWAKIQHVLDIFSKGQGVTGIQQSIVELGLLGADATMVMLTGGILLALPCALLGYYYSLSFFTKQRLKHT